MKKNRKLSKAEKKKITITLIGSKSIIDADLINYPYSNILKVVSFNKLQVQVILNMVLRISY